VTSTPCAVRCWHPRHPVKPIDGGVVFCIMGPLASPCGSADRRSRVADRGPVFTDRGSPAGDRGSRIGDPGLRVRSGDVEVSRNEWARAVNLGEAYWLYVIYDCGTPTPRLVRVQDPFNKLLAKVKGSVLLGARQILDASASNS